MLTPCKGWVSLGETAPRGTRAGPRGCKSRSCSLGMWSRIPQGFALLCNCGDAVLHKFCAASAEAGEKEFGPARLKTRKKKGKKPTPKPPKNSKSRVCVPSDCIFMPTRLLCINVFGAPGGIVSRCSNVLCNRKALGYSETLLNYATDTVPHAPSCARIFPSAAS